MSNILRELRDVYRFFRKTPKKEKVIIFYAEHEGYYPNFEGLIIELTNKHNQTLCYVTSDSHDPILKAPEPRINTFYINKLVSIFMLLINCKVVVMTLTDLNQYHIRRSVNSVHYVYVYHSMVSTHMAYRYNSFDHYDSILCVGPYHIKEIRKHEKDNGLEKKKLVEAGYYRLERIYKAHRHFSSVQHSSTTKGTILIAPSWGPENVLESCGERLVKLLLKAGYEVIVRPHPQTVRRSPKLVDLFSTEFGTNSHFTLETSVALDESILRADVLISDCSGIALEYAFGTERPVLFLDVPIKIQNQRYKELGIEPLELSLRSKIGVIVPPEKLDTVPKVITTLMADKEKYKQRMSQFRDENIYFFGQSSRVGSQYIFDIIGGRGKTS